MAEDEISPKEFEMLHGLYFAGNTYISASEHNHALSLCARGYAEAWTTMGGFHAWRITKKGTEAWQRVAAAALTADMRQGDSRDD